MSGHLIGHRRKLSLNEIIQKNIECQKKRKNYFILMVKTGSCDHDEYSCDHCPITTDSMNDICHLHPKDFKEAVTKIFIELYGKEELMELLL